MSEIIVKPNGKLNGDIKISGSKNASLPIMAACLLTEGKNVLSNIPELSDIDTMCSQLEESGAKINKNGDNIEIECAKISNKLSECSPVNKLRGSFLLAGPLLSRLGKVKIPLSEQIYRRGTAMLN